MSAADRFQGYSLNADVYDEVFLPDGSPRPHCQRLIDSLDDYSDQDLAAIQDRVTGSFYSEGITFTVYGDDEAQERIIPIDCIIRGCSRRRNGTSSPPASPSASRP